MANAPSIDSAKAEAERLGLALLLNACGPLLTARIHLPQAFDFGSSNLATNRDTAGRRIDVKAAIMMPRLALANDHVGVRALNAARYANAVVANLTAYPFGIGGVRERKP
jgi:hypothetical protein